MSCGLRFPYSNIRGAAAAHIAGSEVEDTSPVTELSHTNERAAAGLFNVVRVRRNGQHVEWAQILEGLVRIVHGSIQYE